MRESAHTFFRWYTMRAMKRMIVGVMTAAAFMTAGVPATAGAAGGPDCIIDGSCVNKVGAVVTGKIADVGETYDEQVQPVLNEAACIMLHVLTGRSCE